MTKAETRTEIERVHHRLMDIRDSSPIRRGFITREREYLKVYKIAYRTCTLGDFQGAVERLRLFLQATPQEPE